MAIREGTIHPGRLLQRAILALAAIGLVDSLYLAWLKISQNTAQCFGVGDCEAVNTSIYSAVLGIPIAVFGALAYAAILGVSILEGRSRFFREWGALVVFGLGLAGTLYSAYLTYIEVAVLRKICPYCVVSAIAITLICILSIPRLKRYMQETPVPED